MSKKLDTAPGFTAFDVAKLLLHGKLAKVAEIKWTKSKVFESMPKTMIDVANKYLANRRGSNEDRQVIYAWLEEQKRASQLENPISPVLP